VSERVETERLVGERVGSEHYEALCALLCDRASGPRSAERSHATA
jgi:hypothetical protein